MTKKFLDGAVRGVLRLVNKAAGTGIPQDAFEGMKDDEETTKLVLQAARESIVLMKNTDEVLPLQKNKKVLVIGETAVKRNYTSGGCSGVASYRQISLYDSLSALRKHQRYVVFGRLQQKTASFVLPSS